MLPSGAVASPRPDVLRREQAAFRSIAESTPQPEFEVCRQFYNPETRP